MAWTYNSSDETSFVLERKRGSTGTWAAIANPGPNAFSYSDTGVSPTNAYFYRVKATNADGDSTYSATTNGAVTPAAGTQTSPGSPTVTCISYSKNQITWTDTNSSEDGYRIERKLGAGAWTYVANTLPNVVLYRDENLTADTAYVYRVRAYNIYYTSSWTSELNGTTWKPYLAKMTATTDVISATGNYSFRVERSASSPNLLTVEITTTVPNATFPSSVTIPANARSVAFTLVQNANVTTFGQYYLNGTAAGHTASIPVQLRTPSSSLSPTNFSAQAGAGAVWLFWANPDNAIGTSYPGVRVARRPVGGSFVYITPSVSDIELHVDVDLSAGVTYEYKIDLLDSQGNWVASSSTVSASPASGSSQLSVTGIPTTASAGFEVQVSGSGSGQSEVLLFVDGVLHSRGNPIRDRISGGLPLVYVDVQSLSEGPHTIRVTNELNTGAFSPSYSFAVQGIQNHPLSDGVVVPEIGMFPRIGMKLPSTNLQWSVIIRKPNNEIVRQWSGFGADANVVWDGKDQNGNVVRRSRYICSVVGDGIDYGYCETLRANPTHEFLAIVMLDKSGGVAYDINMGIAERIVANLDARYPGDPGDPGESLPTINAAALVYNENVNVTQYFKKYVKYALKTVRWLYADGHGLVDRTYIGNNLVLSATNVPSSDTDISLGHVVSTRGFGFKWLLNYSCFSSGATSGGPDGDMTTTPNLNFAYWAGTPGNGGYMGVNGLSPKSMNNTGLLATKNRWGRWREIFFDHFIRDGENMFDALYAAHNDCDPPYDTVYAPYVSLIYNGQILPKLVFNGNVIMP